MVDIMIMDIPLEDFKALELGLKDVRIIQADYGVFYKTGRIPCKELIRVNSVPFRG